MLPEWPLVGRSDELEYVEQALQRPGSGGVVVAGAVGVGKTRLARELLQRVAAMGRSTAWVQATSSASAVPFGAFAHLLPNQLSGAGPVNPLRAAGDAIVARSASDPLVLGLDDAHLLDDSSAALTLHLAVSGACFIVATVRSHQPTPDAIHSLWKDGPLERLELQALSQDDMLELFQAMLGDRVDGSTVHRLWEASRGNALYLREVVLGGVEAGLLVLTRGVWRWRGPSLATTRLSELIETRLGELTPGERRVLEIVAHAEPLEASFLDAICERSDRESVERRGLLESLTTGSRHSLRLSHPLYAETVRAATPPSTLPVISHRLADLLAATGARRAGDLLRLATWRLDAGDRMDAEFAAAAARQAIAVQDFVLAERLARAAVDTDDSFDSRLLLAAAAIGLGHRDDAESQLTRLQDRAGNDEQRALAALRRVDNLYGLGRLDEANTILKRAAAGIRSRHWADILMVASARIQCFGGDAEAAVATVRQLLDRPDVSPDLLIEAAPVAIWGRIVTGRTREASALCDRLMPGAERLPGGRHVMFGPSWLRGSRRGAMLVEGRLEETEREAVDEYRRLTAHPADDLRGIHGFTLGWAQRVIGRPRSAAGVLAETVVALRNIDLYRHLAACLGELGQCHAVLGDVSAAEAAVAEADATRVSSFVIDYSFVELARAWTAHTRGEFSRARRIAGGCAERCGSYGQVAFEAFAWHDLARLGDPDAAVGRLQSLVDRVDGALVSAFAAHAVALAAGDPAGLDRVADAFERMGAELYAAEAAAAAALRYRREGRTGSALTAAVRARRLAERCEGARTPALETLDATLPLTAREHEIAGLAARGPSNREIADRLVISVRTVDNHLHNAFAKLGVTHRGDLTGLLLPEVAHGEGR